MSDHRASQLTHRLSTAPCSVVIQRRKGRWWLPVLVVAVLASGAGYALYPARESGEAALRASIETLQRENQRLAQEAKLQTMNYQHEQAVRESLERELAAQGEVLKKAQKDLAFYRTNTGRAGQ